MRCKGYIFFPLVLVLLAAGGLRADDAPTLDTTATKKDNISIRLPAGWVVDDNAPHAILHASAPQRDQDESSDFQAVLSISSVSGNIVDGAAQQERLTREIPSYKVVEKPTRVKIGKLEAVTFGGTFTQGPIKLRARHYMLTKDDRIYIVTFTSLESHWLDYVGLLEASVDTFTIADKGKN